MIGLTFWTTREVVEVCAVGVVLFCFITLIATLIIRRLR